MRKKFIITGAGRATGADNHTHHSFFRGRLFGKIVRKNKTNHNKGKYKNAIWADKKGNPFQKE